MDLPRVHSLVASGAARCVRIMRKVPGRVLPRVSLVRARRGTGDARAQVEWRWYEKRAVGAMPSARSSVIVDNECVSSSIARAIAPVKRARQTGGYVNWRRGAARQGRPRSLTRCEVE